MKIAFLEGFLNIRGTSIALFDYAHFNETILGHQSIVLTEPFEHRAWHPDGSMDVHTKFKNRFPVFYYTCNNDIQQILEREHVDVLYVIKSGRREGVCDVFPNVKTIMHCVFDPVEPHGDAYCVISEWLNIQHHTQFKVLPHIVYLPETDENLRGVLGIPDDAIVFGRYGGIGELDLPYAHAAIQRISHDFPNIYFLLMNTKQNVAPPSKNVLYFERTVDLHTKTKFINTCDAMIYGRRQGESFGLAIAEFSSRNKPIIAPLEMTDRMHQMILGDNAIWYDHEEDLYDKMKDFKKDNHNKDWNMYRQYSPENVMKIFQEILDGMGDT